jgi:peroxiredoxin
MKTERLLQIGIGILFVVLIAVVADTIHERVVGVGDKAPDFKITTDSGRTISRSDFGGQVLVLNFWATWCPPCVEEMPSLDAFQRRLKGSGVVVLGISVDKNEKAYRDFLKKAGVSFETARDAEARISASYGTYKYPETYVIDRKGEVVEKFVGFEQTWTDDNVVNRIKRYL